MTDVRELRVIVPVEVLDRARRQLGAGATIAEAVRHALALMAGVDPADYPVRRPGRPRESYAGTTVEDRRAVTAAARRARAARASGDRVSA